MDWKAKWVWSEGEESPRNFWLAARKVITVRGSMKTATLSVTADSRYVAWVNGKRVGQGPVRSWPWNWSYDTYDVKGLLKPGKNVISILVMHYGVSNFQYIAARGGLLAQLDMVTARGKKISIGTDRTWKGIPHPSYSRRTPRICCQMGWVESYDARKDPAGWHNADAHGKKWKSLAELGTVGTGPWKKLVPRDIPFLTEEPVYPVRVLRTRVVSSGRQHFAFDLRPNLLPGNRMSNPSPLVGFAAAVLRSPRATTARIFYCGTPAEVEHRMGLEGKDSANNVQGAIRVNGKDCPWVGQNTFDTAGIHTTCRLKKGDNLIIWDLCRGYHNWHLNFSLDVPFRARLRAPFSPAGGATAATLGPLDPEDIETLDGIWDAAGEQDLRPYRRFLKNVRTADEVADHVFSETVQAKPTGEKVKISGAEALCAANEDAACIWPARSGDVELLVDFGREVAGFLEFELEGEPGIVLDFNCFESIQEGRIDFCWTMHNVLRYRTRSGRRSYHSVVRRGFRYALLVVRFPAGCRGPLRIRSLSCSLNTYPVVERGSFACDDMLLNDIWKLGRYTTRLCSEDTFVDCPAYEQAFWVGDSRNEGAANHVAFGEYALTRRCLLLAAESVKRSPVIESQVPSGWVEILPAWSFLWTMACEEFYQLTGDLDFVRKGYPAVARQNRGFEGMLLEGLISIDAWNMLDWAPLDTPSDAIAVTHQNAWYVESLRRSARLASLLGKKQDASRWLRSAEKTKKAINELLWDGKRRAYIDCIRHDGSRSPVVSQQTNTVVLLCECAPPARRRLIRRYVDSVPRGFVKAGSPFMMFFIFEAMAREGDFRKILELSRRRWGFMLEKDATTCWEVFPGFEPSGSWTRSHCHAWSAAPTYFLSAYQLGVTPEKPGFTVARIAPEPAGLKWARGSMPTPHGPVQVEWNDSRGVFSITVSLPEGVSGRIVLPGSVSRRARLEIMGTGGKPRFAGGRWNVRMRKGGKATVKARGV